MTHQSIDIEESAARRLFLQTFQTVPVPAGSALALETDGGPVTPSFVLSNQTAALAVLDNLPHDLTPWQRAFWLVSENIHLDGLRPIDRLDDPATIMAARKAYEMPIG